MMRFPGTGPLSVFLFTLFLSGTAGLHAAGASSIGSAELYSIDTSHSAMEFVVEFMGLSKVRGRFADFDGSIVFDPDDPESSSVALVIPVKSIDTDNDFRDRHLKSPDWFDHESHPRITFQSRSIERTGPAAFLVRGPLTIRGVTKEVEIPIAMIHPDRTDAWGNRRIGFTGSVVIDRHDFGVKGTSLFNESFDASRMGVSEDVRIDLTVSGRIFNMDRISFGGSEEKPAIGEVLHPILREKGVAAAIEHYRQLESDSPDDYDFSVRQLNTLGYKLLQNGEGEAAVAILELAVDEHPDVAALLDSLGYAYAAVGRKADAIRTFRTALEMDPAMTSSIEMLRQLEGKTGTITLR